MTIHWHEKLSVENDWIDSDHKYLFEQINQVKQGLKTYDRSRLTNLIKDFYDFLVAHFAREEKIVRVIGNDPLLQQLYESHLTLLIRLNQIQKENGEVWKDSSIEQIGIFLGDLLIHIIKEDLMMKPTLRKYSPSFIPI